MRVIDLGLIPYEQASALQDEAVAQVLSGGEERLFLLEHPPTITYGRNGGRENLPLAPEYFEALGVDLVQSSRGGNITCHFPGQMVAYPIIRVDRRAGGLRAFFHNMEEAAIRTLARFDVTAKRAEGRPGVWVNGAKIASIGIGVKHWVTYHGLAMNIGPDLALFTKVSPCGLPVPATSLAREQGGQGPAMSEVKEAFLREFLCLFKKSQKT